MLPMHLQMMIDLMAADAKREVAEGFAAARARLLPDPVSDPQRAYLLGLQQALGALDPRWWLAADPRGLNWARNYNNAAAQQNVGMEGLGSVIGCACSLMLF